MVVPSTGSYLLTVALAAAAPGDGTYRLLRAAPRVATPADATRIAAERAFAEAERLQAEGTAEACRQSTARAREAATLAHQAGDARREALARETALGSLYLTSDFHEAEKEGLLALELWKSLGDDRGQCDTLGNLAAVAIGLSDFEQALGLYQQALPLTQRPGVEALEGPIVHGIGFVHQALGDDRVALDYYRRALALETRPGHHEDTSGTRDTIGMVLLNLKDYRGALASLQRGLAEREALKDRRGQGISHAHIGWVYDDEGKHEAALVQYQTALELSRAAGDRFSVAIVLDTLGTTLRTLGRKAEALSCHQEALEVARSIGEKDEEEIALTHIGRLQRDLGQLEEARETLLQALEQTEAVRSALVAPDHRASYLARIRGRYDLLIDVLVRLHRQNSSHGYDAQALLVSERARARGLLDFLAQAKVNLPATATAPQNSALATPRLLDVADIRREVIDADTLLLEYALGDERSELWVLGEDSLAVYELPARAVVEAAARKLYARWSSNSLDPDEERLARALGAMLLGPARETLGHKRLLISADGALHFLPFGALVLPGQLQRRVLEAHEVVAIPSASTLAALRERRPAPLPAGATLAVFADPVFSASDERVSPNGRAPVPAVVPADLQRSASESGLHGFQRLPATRREAESILGLLPAGAGLAALDFQANRSTAMDAELARYRIVHFATHGLFNSQHPELSGLVLSLVDASGQPENGFLRVQDVFGMTLGADLVVLSACQTALGKDIRGEGLVGLTRGFMYAGAPRVVASLWKVADRATAELMRRFYSALLLEGTSPAAALRNAELELKHQRPFSSPYAWAAFTFQGEWR